MDPVRFRSAVLRGLVHEHVVRRLAGGAGAVPVGDGVGVGVGPAGCWLPTVGRVRSAGSRPAAARAIRICVGLGWRQLVHLVVPCPPS